MVNEHKLFADSSKLFDAIIILEGVSECVIAPSFDQSKEIRINNG